MACVLPGNRASPSHRGQLQLMIIESPCSPTSLPQPRVFHITAEEMPNSIKTTCKALIIKQSLAGVQGWEQLYAFKSRWRWCPAPAAARQPGDRSTRVRLVLQRATAFVTREAGRHGSLNQLTGVTCNLHYSLGSRLLRVQGRRLTRAAQCLALPQLHQLHQPEVPEQSRVASYSTFTSSANTSSV